MKYYALYNPYAGLGDAGERCRELSVLYGEDIVYKDITEIEDYNEFFSTVGAGDAVIICGGDGTLNRFANSVSDVDVKCEIIYYAMGTGNDFLHDVRGGGGVVPISVKKYIQNLPTVEVNGKTYRFLNNVGFGIDGYCCEVGDKMKASSDKPVNYTSIAINGLLFHYKPTRATVRVDGVEYKYKKVWLAPTMKGRFYGGGMMATPEQDRTDPEGKLSVMIFYGKGRLRTLMAFPSIFKGEHVKHTNMVKIHTGTEISVEFDKPTALQIDGETILGVTSYRARATADVLTKSN